MEVIFAILILFIATFFMFEIIITSYTHIKKMTIMSQLVELTKTKMENILYQNTATTSGWSSVYLQNDEYQISVQADRLTVTNLFRNYQITRVVVRARGPMHKINIPEYNFSLSSYILDDSQSVSSTTENEWGKGYSPEVIHQ